MSTEEKEIRHCPNCGEIVDNKFCPSCGQENREYKANFKEMFREYFSHVLNLDSRLYRTLKYLLTKPGLLTQEYFKGRRESYISPLRLYLIISMVYFLTFTVQNIYTDIMTGIERAVSETSEIVSDSLHVSLADSSQVQVENDSINVDNGTIDIFGDGVPFDEKEILATFMSNLPKVMFFLLPLGALILKLLYRRKILYYEHVIFLLHVHSFFFLVMFIDRLQPFEIVSDILMLLIILYLFLAMKRYYLQKIGKTILKMFLFSSGYFLTMAILLLGNILITILSVM